MLPWRIAEYDIRINTYSAIYHLMMSIVYIVIMVSQFNYIVIVNTARECEFMYMLDIQCTIMCCEIGILTSSIITSKAHG